MNKVRNIIEGLPSDVQALFEPFLSIKISGLTDDSRKVVSGSVYVALQGTHSNGHAYIRDALDAGAHLIIGEEELGTSVGLPYVALKDARYWLSILAGNFYKNPSHSMKVIGVTGTSGKTTVTYLLESIFSQASKTGVIGTVNYRYGDSVLPSTHTTPGAVELQKILAEMKLSGCQTVVMEVSSHGIRQGRVHGVAFDAALFTNLSQDHLDYHVDMMDYFDSKALLFTDVLPLSAEAGKTPIAVINGRDHFGRRLAQKLDPKFQRSEYRIAEEDFYNLKWGVDGIHGKVRGVNIRSSLLGEFNIENIVSAVSVAKLMGIPSDQISAGVETLKGVPGRLEKVANDRGIDVFVDYAHKPDALEKVLEGLSEYREMKEKESGKRPRIITVFGCGGNRDREKRPLMGQISKKYSDQVVVTSDNPRDEKPEGIISEILLGVDQTENFGMEVDREKAIHTAVLSASEGDIVLIAGKGHENYQIIGNQRIDFDDRVVVKNVFNSE